MKGTFKVTLDYLKELGACRDGQREFQKAFPDGGEYQSILDRCAEKAAWILALGCLTALARPRTHAPTKTR